jgi:biotin synthase
MSDLTQALIRCQSMAEPDFNDILFLLSRTGKDEMASICSFADEVRRANVGNGIFLRGIVEFSSYCSKTCAYCGLNSNNKGLPRYRMTMDEVLSAVELLSVDGIKTVVLQSGEDDTLIPEWLAEVVGEIKKRFDIAVTLSVGERPSSDYELWKKAGADRYLLKVETSDRNLYEKLHPGMDHDTRIGCLRELKRLGYQVGSGVIVGLPGQTSEILARDIQFFKQENLDMIGIGPFIPHRQTGCRDALPGDIDMTLMMVAVTRIVTGNTHLPATTALGSLDGDHRMAALQAGANVLMPNYTPAPFRTQYEIYPDKRCVDEPVGACNNCMEGMASRIGRVIDYSIGHSMKTGSTGFGETALSHDNSLV